MVKKAKKRRLDERTLRMMDEFMDLHNAGWSLDEIADKFGLCTRTVRNHLQEIADKYGVTRESLQKRVHTKHASYVRKFEPVTPVSVDDLNEQFDAIFNGLETLIDIINRDIEKQEQYALDLKGRVEEWN